VPKLARDIGGRPRDAGPAPFTGNRRAALIGVAAIVVFLGGFGTWAAVAPLESAAVAPGAVQVDFNRKTVQHLEGGIVARIMVRDGDVVAAGQELVRLDDTRARATLDLLRGRYLADRAVEARLIAERDGLDRIVFPSELKLLTGEVETIVSGQNNIFKARRETLTTQRGILRQRIAALQAEVTGLTAKIAAQGTQLRLVAEELVDVRSLYEQGLAKKARMLALERAVAEIEGDRADNRAKVARARQQITEAELKIAELNSNALNEVLKELREVQAQLHDIGERMRAAEDVLKRTTIVAPLGGTVVGLQVYTTGGVIGAGDRLLDIVPSAERLVVEAQVDPSDIDVVQPGLPAHVRLTPFNARSTRSIGGRVASVSADKLTDQKTGQMFYRARVELDEDPKAALNGASLYPGMPAEVMIVTGARTALQYLIRPVSRSLDRAFRED
jgi:HlyD family type I secretion membrane fusion protein